MYDDSRMVKKHHYLTLMVLWFLNVFFPCNLERVNKKQNPGELMPSGSRCQFDQGILPRVLHPQC